VLGAGSVTPVAAVRFDLEDRAGTYRRTGHPRSGWTPSAMHPAPSDQDPGVRSRAPNAWAEARGMVLPEGASVRLKFPARSQPSKRTAATGGGAVHRAAATAPPASRGSHVERSQIGLNSPRRSSSNGRCALAGCQTSRSRSNWGAESCGVQTSTVVAGTCKHARSASARRVILW